MSSNLTDYYRALLREHPPKKPKKRLTKAEERAKAQKKAKAAKQKAWKKTYGASSRKPMTAKAKIKAAEAAAKRAQKKIHAAAEKRAKQALRARALIRR